MILTGYTALVVVRFELSVPSHFWGRLRIFLPAAVVVHLVANRLWGAYGHMWEYASIEEARRLLLAGVTSGAVLFAMFAWEGARRMPLSVLLMGPLLTTILLGAVRFQSRLFAFRQGAKRPIGLRVVVVGAGSAGASILREMRRNEHIGLTPVAVVDDDRRIQGRSLHGVSVAGDIDELARVVVDREAHQVLLAIPSGGPEVARRVAEQASAAEVPVKILPAIADLIHGQVSLRDARDLRIDDLLGRQQVKIDLEVIQEALRGRRILITGGGGSIGSEIARQVSEFEPAALTLLDQDETHLHDALARLPAFVDQVLADVRDRAVIDRVFDQIRPDIVFHAAAHKHVPILEQHACEAVQTNVLGTMHVADAAVRVGVERLVFVSTDKAALPTSVMGASKWLGEQIVVARTPPGSKYCCVRFGNVLGSRGSVIPTFQRQIAAGGPLTVTDAGMTRFFMSSSEAVSLVLQAAAIARDREVFMLDMGEPVNILDLAERMIRLCGLEVGSDIAIEITGSRPGEKLVEELRAPWETVTPTAHPSVVGLQPARLPAESLKRTVEQLESTALRGDQDEARRLLLHIVTVIPAPSGEAPAGPETGAAPAVAPRQA
jgi:FlaA1/EpsC-like NDP-sugar epimerase